MDRSIINIDDLEFQSWGRAAEPPGTGEADGKFEARIAFVGGRVGARKLGYNVTGRDGKPTMTRFVGRLDTSLPYWEDE